MEIIPAIDLIDGQCVRLLYGDYQKKTVYDSDPIAMAQRFEDAGLKRLHLVDLDGAKAGEVQNWDVLEGICKKTNLVVDFSGGLRARAEAERALALGATFVSVGSVAAKEPELFQDWVEALGPEQIILGADVKDGRIAVSGWEQSTSLELFPFLKEKRALGIQKVVCTDISRDGALQGPSLELYTQVLEAEPGLELIASGGVSSLDDVLALKELGVAGAIIGKALYEKRVSLDELGGLVC